MDGEIDLELFTLAVLKLNSSLQKIENNDTAGVNDLIKDSNNDFKTLYDDVKNDISQKEINYNEYDVFFENIKLKFPGYLDTIGEYIETVKDEDINKSLSELLNIFNEYIKTSEEYFESRGIYQ